MMAMSAIFPGLPNFPTVFRITSSPQHHGVLSKTQSFMKIHEYQAKTILSKYGVAVPRGEMALTREEADSAAKRLFGAGASGVVVKAQIHAGGRGKGGGVKVAKTLDEANAWAHKILAMNLVTHQTDPEVKIIQRFLLEETLPIERELYLGIVVDRVTARPVFRAPA